MTNNVLLIEDDPSILRGLELNLRVDGYRVLTAGDGLAALRSFAAARPDLIILDLGLPSIDGLDVIRHVRQVDQDVPILVLSARQGEPEKVSALSLGADDYVTKPFGLAELLARVRVLLRRRRRTAMPELLTFGRVDMDLAARVLRVGGRVVEVTALEFDLLRYLATQPMRAFTREQIMQAVWGAGHAGTLRTVDNFIARLRTKIELDPSDPRLIETVRGVGYRFNPRRDEEPPASGGS
jgi:DNA-binding response OmpR family regulator